VERDTIWPGINLSPFRRNILSPFSK